MGKGGAPNEWRRWKVQPGQVELIMAIQAACRLPEEQYVQILSLVANYLADPVSFMYFGGGFDGGNCLKSVHRYDLRQQIWTQIPDMKFQRVGLGLAVLKNKLYAIGGHPGGAPMNSMEVYDPESNSWNAAPSMNFPREYFSVAASQEENLIYAAGGQGDARGVSSKTAVECFNANTNSWQTLAHMLLPRAHFALAVLDGKLYAMGGDGSDVCEVYTPATNSWRRIAPMCSPRTGHAACTVNNTIVVVGGTKSDDHFPPFSEFYDPVKDVWTPINSIAFPRHRLAAAYAPGACTMLVLGGDSANNNASSDADLVQFAHSFGLDGAPQPVHTKLPPLAFGKRTRWSGTC